MRSLAEYLAAKIKAKERKAKRRAKRVELAAHGWPTEKIRRARKKQIVKRLDAVFSLLVRMKTKQDIGHCFFCPKPIEHCFHFITRAKYSIRWDFRNAVGSCAGCNLRNEYDPHGFIARFISCWGLPAYERLVQDGNQRGKPTGELMAMLCDMQEGRLKP